MNNSIQQPVILYDFDGTLFDTQRLKKSIEEGLAPITTAFDTLWSIEKELRHTPTHIAETIKQFCEKEGLQDQIDQIQRVFLHQEFSSFLFPDTLPTLEILSTKCTQLLFTQGDESYQQVKVYGSQLQKYFSQLFIFQDKIAHLEEIVSKYPNQEVWFIDNQLKYLEKATNIAPQVQTIWINREGLQRETPFVPNREVQELSALITLFGSHS